MSVEARRALVAKILFVLAVLMFITAALIAARVIPMDDPSRVYVAAAIAAVGATDVMLALFFLKGGR